MFLTLGYVLLACVFVESCFYILSEVFFFSEEIDVFKLKLACS